MLARENLILVVSGMGISLIALALSRSGRRRVARGQLWASPLTTCSRRAIAACVEAGAQFRFVPIHLAKGEHKQARYITLQPYGKVPAWRDADGFDLFESRAIMRHVAKGTPLIPVHDAKALALMEQWISVEQSHFQPVFLPIYSMRVLKTMPLDEARCQQLSTELEVTLNLMEEHLKLSGQPYLANASFTLADLTHLCYFQVFDAAGLQDLLESRPALAHWWARCSSRPAWSYTMSQHFVVEHACAPDPLGRAKPWDP
mmetsp:Transcript_43560/g.114489  ORF Transcript_43560/g.114489 Transcript_43560/m.114489 type:complete len:259 (+) Transcript_43560:40-816(+)